MAVVQIAPLVVTSLTNQLSGDVTLTNANQYYDGPAVSLTPGTWLLTGGVTLLDSSANNVYWTGKLWDGTTVADSREANKRTAANEGVALSFAGVVTVAATTTWKISAACSGAGTLIKAAAVHNAAGNTASSLVAVRIG